MNREETIQDLLRSSFRYLSESKPDKDRNKIMAKSLQKFLQNDKKSLNYVKKIMEEGNKKWKKEMDRINKSNGKFFKEFGFFNYNTFKEIKKKS